MADNVVGMLAYFTFIPALIFIVIEPYNKNRFVRFHSFQSLFFHLAWFVIWIRDQSYCAPSDPGLAHDPHCAYCLACRGSSYGSSL